MNINADTSDAGQLVRAIEACAGILAGAHPDYVTTARNVLLALPAEHRMFPAPVRKGDRFRRTKHELAAGMTVEQAMAARTGAKWGLLIATTA